MATTGRPAVKAGPSQRQNFGAEDSGVRNHTSAPLPVIAAIEPACATKCKMLGRSGIQSQVAGDSGGTVLRCAAIALKLADTLPHSRSFCDRNTFYMPHMDTSLLISRAN